MDIRFLESLIAVVDSGSIAGAARLQGLTAAAVSQRIQTLERDLGCKLLSRTSHSAKPTQACLDLLPRSRKLVREIEALRWDIDASGLSGKLCIGAISTVLTGLLPSTLHKMSSMAPRVQANIMPGTSQMLYDALRAQNLDAAIIVEPPFDIPQTLTADLLRKEPLLLLSRSENVGSPEELLGAHPYICYDSKSWGGRIARQYLSDKGLNPATFCELDALEAIHLLVTQGMGVSLVPQWAGLKLEHGWLKALPIEDDCYLRKIVLLTPAQPNRPKITEMLKTSLGVSPS